MCRAAAEKRSGTTGENRGDLMRILIVTAGSRGDVAPFTGLGQRLQQAGHQVALGAHDRFADLVRECGLEYRALPGDAFELARARTAAPSQEDVRAVFPEFLDELGDGVLAATAAGTDMLLTPYGPGPLCRLVTEGFGIPSLGVYLAPCVPTREFPPPGRPVTGQLSSADNLAAGRQVFAQTGPPTPTFCGGCAPCSISPPPARRRRARRMTGRSATASARQ